MSTKAPSQRKDSGYLDETVKPKAMKERKRQPHHLVSDILLEILAWLAWNDWHSATENVFDFPNAHIRKKKQIPNKSLTVAKSLKCGYDLVRASHVCRYWRDTALSHKSLWRYFLYDIGKDERLVRREINTRNQRSNGLAQALFLAYTDRSAPIGNKKALEVENLTYDSEPIKHCGAPANSHFLDHLPRTSVLVLKGTRSQINQIFGYHHQTHPLLAMNLHPRSTTGKASDKQHADLAVLRKLAIDITDFAFTIFFPPLPNLTALSLRVHTQSKPFVLPCDLIDTSSAAAPDTAGGFVPSKSMVLFPSLRHLSLEFEELDSSSLHSFLDDHSSNLVTLRVEITGASLSAPFSRPKTPLYFPKLQIVQFGRTSPHGLRHLRSWDCPSLAEMILDTCHGSPSKTDPQPLHFPTLKRLNFMFLDRPVDGDANSASSSTEYFSEILAKTLPELTELEELTVRNWHHVASKNVDWVKALMPLKMSTHSEVSTHSHSKTAVSRPSEPPVAERRLRRQSSAMWTSISTEGLLLDENSRPLSATAIDSMKTTGVISRDVFDDREHTGDEDEGEEHSNDEEEEESGLEVAELVEEGKTKAASGEDEDEEAPPCSQLTEADAEILSTQAKPDKNLEETSDTDSDAGEADDEND
ncbi:hypothetical protein FRC17_006035, partial [Serendipita sp. 399]